MIKNTVAMLLQITNVYHKQTVTVLECGMATSQFFVFPGKKMNQDLMSGGRFTKKNSELFIVSKFAHYFSGVRFDLVSFLFCV